MAEWKKVVEDLQERNLITTKEASELHKFNEDLEKDAFKIPIGKAVSKVVGILSDNRFHSAMIGGILALPAINAIADKITGPMAYNRDYREMKNSLERRYPSTMQSVKQNKEESKLHEAFEVLYKFSPTVAKTPTLASDAVHNFYLNKDIFTIDALHKLVQIEKDVPGPASTKPLIPKKVVEAVTKSVTSQTKGIVGMTALQNVGLKGMFGDAIKTQATMEAAKDSAKDKNKKNGK